MPEDGLLPIGELAHRTGVATSALRYYERIGLLSPAARAGQRRQYTASSAERVALIRLDQDAGFTLEEIGRMLAARRQRSPHLSTLPLGPRGSATGPRSPCQ